MPVTFVHRGSNPRSEAKGRTGGEGAMFESSLLKSPTIAGGYTCIRSWDELWRSVNGLQNCLACTRALS